mgnify:CR=1 FL=1
MLFEKTYGIDLGSSYRKSLFFFQKQTYIEEKYDRVPRDTRSLQWEMKHTICLRNPPQILRLLHQ